MSKKRNKMKLVKAKEKASKIDIFLVGLNEIEQYILFAYLFCMLGIFPLFYREQYYKIGDAKFGFFWKVSLVFIVTSFVLFVIKKLLQKMDRQKNMISGRSKKSEKELQQNRNVFFDFLEELSTLDYLVLVYGICVCLSYAFSDYKEYAWRGAAGWEMGFCSQLIFVATYFILSRKNEWLASISRRDSKKEYGYFASTILGIHLLASSLVFMFGILHRFDMDPLGMYLGLELNQKIEFLSTIGQATWFSSYVCTTFAIGVALFYISEKIWIRVVSGVYTVLSFGILVTQNSDSAFIAIAGILLLLGYFSLSKIETWIRFLQIVSLMWGTFAAVGLLQRLFVDWAIPLDTLSVFFSQSIFTWGMLLLSLLLYLFYEKNVKKEQNEKLSYRKKKEKIDAIDKEERCKRIMQITKMVYQGILIALVIGIFATIIFIYLNTKGYLLSWFGYQNSHSYLLFDYHWGSNRGSTWMITWQAFSQMPFYQKLFGVGPDSLSEYLYSVPDISDLLRSLWGNMRLTNAHNEYLNSLMCYGIVGLVSWCGVLFGGISYFHKKAKENPFMIGFALCIMGYACHNIFCYQQVCCTPFLFILLGIGESLTKSENFNTIK